MNDCYDCGLYLIIDNEVVTDMYDENRSMNSLADYEAAIATSLEDAYKIADRFLEEDEVSQAIILPIEADCVLAATLKPVHEVLCLPEGVVEPSLPAPVEFDEHGDIVE